MHLADGEDLISFEVDERSKTLVDDPRQELLEHRRAAESADEAVLGHEFRDLGETWTQQPVVDPAERPARDQRLAHRENTRSQR